MLLFCSHLFAALTGVCLTCTIWHNTNDGVTVGLSFGTVAFAALSFFSALSYAQDR